MYQHPAAQHRSRKAVALARTAGGTDGTWMWRGTFLLGAAAWAALALLLKAVV